MTSSRDHPAWAAEVLSFWFGELRPEQWFSGGAELDATIRQRFADLHARLARDVPPACRTEPDAALAAVIALDQFPRNIHRGGAQAFSTDDMAISLARNAVDKGLHDTLGPAERKFLFMPFMHSENLADQERGVSLFRAVGDEEALRYAIEHRDIIHDYGRFPHRNRTLGRESTEAEKAFLARHQGFGQ